MQRVRTAYKIASILFANKHSEFHANTFTNKKNITSVFKFQPEYQCFVMWVR
jgi:hypothetical protein